MIRNTIMAGLLVLAGTYSLGAQEPWTEADRLYDQENYREAYAALEKILPGVSGEQKGQVYIRLARATVKVGNELKASGAPQAQLLAHYEKGEGFGREAVRLAPRDPRAWFWKSSNTGRWAQTKGVLDSLFKASDMKADLEQALKLDGNFSDAYYVLGMLYEALPGWPVSFGNPVWAVSLGRKSVALTEKEVVDGGRKLPVFDFYLELAKHLWARNWDSGKRRAELAGQKTEYAKAQDDVTRGSWFESQTALANQSDRQEALEIVRKTITQLEASGLGTKALKDDLANARKLLAVFQKG